MNMSKSVKYLNYFIIIVILSIKGMLILESKRLDNKIEEYANIDYVANTYLNKEIISLMKKVERMSVEPILKGGEITKGRVLGGQLNWITTQNLSLHLNRMMYRNYDLFLKFKSLESEGDITLPKFKVKIKEVGTIGLITLDVLYELTFLNKEEVLYSLKQQLTYTR